MTAATMAAGAGLAEPPLSRGITGTGYFALAFGTIVGSAWMVLMGDWVSPAGPGGAVLAFLATSLLMVPIAAAYSELVARVPKAGAEFVFVSKGIGPTWGFATGWFLTLYYVGIAAFEGLALAWFIENLFPALASSTVLYTLLGHDITILDLIVGLVGASVMTLFNASGVTVAVGFQRIVTFGFLGTSALLVMLGFAQGDTANWHPLFTPLHGGSLGAGLFAMSATAAMWLSGFQTAASAVEERSAKASLHTVAYAMMGAVVVAAIFYSLIILSSASLAPWHELTSGKLPVAAAFDHALPGGLATKAIILVAMASLLKTWNAMHLCASRVILAQARDGFLPAGLAHIDPRTGAPRRAALLVGLVTCIGVVAGRGAISPIISMGTMCVTLIAALALVALIQLRKRPSERPEFVFAGGKPALLATTIGAVLVAISAVASPFQAATGIPPEIWLVLAWTAIGAAMLGLRGGRSATVG